LKVPFAIAAIVELRILVKFAAEPDNAKAGAWDGGGGGGGAATDVIIPPAGAGAVEAELGAVPWAEEAW